MSSMAIIAVKRCHTGVATDEEVKELKTAEDRNRYISRYFIKLHIFHLIALICGSVIMVFAFVDVSPHTDDDINFAFHFISVFVIAIIGVLTLYGCFIAYSKPCTTSLDSKCCEVIAAPKLFSNSDRKHISAFTESDHSMIAVIVLDVMTALLLL
ncbi:unnamed protein product, partial [Medioppia subpectinata]